MNKKSTTILLTLILIITGATFAQKVEYSAEEMKVFKNINSFRTKNHLEALVLSDKLSEVASAHITDLTDNYRSETGCSLHSWSDRGNWTPCCNTKNIDGINCMKIKPNEIANYDGLGFELIYWDEKEADGKDAVELWTESQASKEMILCNGKWNSFNWKMMGVAVRGNYAIIWFGDKLDTGKVIKIDKKIDEKKNDVKVNTVVIKENVEEIQKEKEDTQPQIINIPPAAKMSYHIVVASVKSEETAKEALSKYKNMGYKNARIIRNKDTYRLVIDSSSTDADAREKLKVYKKTFPDCWLLDE